MSLHAEAVSTLRHWSAPSPDQDKVREDFLVHLDRHPDGVWRACRTGHITASALLVDAGMRRTLLTLHRLADMWLQLGGHCEQADENLAAAALREATEESGISGLEILPGPARLDRHPVVCKPPGGTTPTPSVHLDVQYIVVAPPDAVERISAESVDLRWFDLAALPSTADEALRRLAQRAEAHSR